MSSNNYDTDDRLIIASFMVYLVCAIMTVLLTVLANVLDAGEIQHYCVIGATVIFVGAFIVALPLLVAFSDDDSGFMLLPVGALMLFGAVFVLCFLYGPWGFVFAVSAVCLFGLIGAAGLVFAARKQS